MGQMLLCCYLNPWENRGYIKFCLLLSARTLHRLEIKFLIGIFFGVPTMNFILDWVAEIVNVTGLQTISLEN